MSKKDTIHWDDDDYETEEEVSSETEKQKRINERRNKKLNKMWHKEDLIDS